MLASIINGLKKAIKLGGRVWKNPAAAGTLARKRFERLFTKRGLKDLAKLGLSKSKTAIWLRRGVKLLKTKKSFLGMAGKLGTQLKGASGGLGWLGRGLSAFDIDFRSPRQFRKDMKAQQESISMMKLRRDQVQARAENVQKELKQPPIDLSGIESPNEKLDTLGGHISEMRDSIGDIKYSSESTKANVKSFEENQALTNNALLEAVTIGNQQTMKSTIATVEHAKEATVATIGDAQENIIANISGKIDAMEAAKKEEEEFRRKNDWKRKFLSRLVWLIDWIVNWPRKLLIRIGLILAGVFGYFIIKYWNPLKTFFSMSFAGMLKQIGLRLVQLYAWFRETINGMMLKLIKWFVSTMKGLANSVLGAFKDIPGLKWIAKAGIAYNNFLDKGVQWIADKLAEGNKATFGRMKEWAKGLADKQMEDQAKENDAQKLKEVAAKAAAGKFQSIPVPNTANNEADNASEGDVKIESSDEKTDSDQSNIDSIKDSVGTIRDEYLARLANFMGSDTVQEPTKSVMKAGKDAANIVTEKVGEAADAVKESSTEAINAVGKATKELEPMVKEIKESQKAIAEGLDKLAQNAKGNQQTIMEGENDNFDEPSNRYQNQNQYS